MTDRAGELGTFCALLPVPAADADAVRAAVAGWDQGDGSPFARVPGTHFARLVLIDELRREAARQPEDTLPGPVLMLSAFCDGDPDAWLAGLCRALPAEAYAVLRHCLGCPGDPAERPHAFRAWLLERRAPATAVFAAHPQATLAAVRSALAFREAFTAFAFDPERQLAGGAASFDAFRAFAREHAP